MSFSSRAVSAASEALRNLKMLGAVLLGASGCAAAGHLLMCCTLNYVLIAGSQWEAFSQPTAARPAGPSPIDKSALIGPGIGPRSRVWAHAGTSSSSSYRYRSRLLRPGSEGLRAQMGSIWLAPRGWRLLLIHGGGGGGGGGECFVRGAFERLQLVG